MTPKNSPDNHASKNNKTSNKGPDFIGVGPEKTGTTWIYKHLNTHPETRCTPVKELRYFWENLAFPGESFLHRLLHRKSWHNPQYRAYFRQRFRTYLRQPGTLRDTRRLAWDLKYLFARHDDNWYLSSFDNTPGCISGEVSPQYFFLPEAEVARICELLPDTKFIISLRYPPEWAWSFARMMVRIRELENSEEAIEGFIRELKEEKSFAKSLQIWKKYVPEDRLKIVYFDQLRDQPQELFNEICDFLGIQPMTKELAQFKAAVNKGKKREIPDRFRTMLAKGWQDEIAALDRALPDLPEAWRTRKF